jgi:hypothetical protein
LVDGLVGSGLKQFFRLLAQIVSDLYLLAVLPAALRASILLAT